MAEISSRDGQVSIMDGLVCFNSTSVKISEITQVQLRSYRTGDNKMIAAWLVAALSFVIWLPAPSDNAAILPFLIPLVGYAVYKQLHPKPTRHSLLLGTGSLLNKTVIDTTDLEEVTRLRNVIEAAMSNLERERSAVG